MKKLFFLLIIFCSSLLLFNNCSAQVGEWVWLKGNSSPYGVGNSGIKGMPGMTNTPPALYEPCEWTDLNGNFWLFGGTSQFANVHDNLWKYDPLANEWTWMTGTNGLNSRGNYGTQGMPSASNSPPARGYGFASWVDLNGNLWMFGGSSDSSGTLSDLWKYDIVSNEWTWMKGPNTGNQPGVYGTQGVPDPANNPVGRSECASAWTDDAGDLWLFGGLDYGTYNDLWRYNIASNTWTWMKGSSIANQPGWRGTQGVEDSLNTPGAREVHCRWKGNDGNLWFYGGQYTNFSVYDNYNDLWRFNPLTNNWTWMNGDSVPNVQGIYGSKCTTDSADNPPAMMENRAAWKDVNGNFWFYGGGIDYGETQVMNHLWMYCIASNKWTWMGGDSTANSPGSWGSMGIANATNTPGGRGGSVAWTDNNGHLYLFGGTSAITGITIIPYNDLWQFTIDPCCSSCSISSLVPSFQADDTTLCIGDCNNYTDHSINASAWQWTFQGGTPATSSDHNPSGICYYASGKYNVTLIASNCLSSDTVTLTDYINVFPSPVTPNITQSHDTIFCSTDPSYISYQWYSGDSLIGGATDTAYSPVHAGNYNMKVVDTNGCSIAVGFTVGLKNYTAQYTFHISPDPAADQLIIDGNWQHVNGAVNIYNVIGQKVQEERTQLDKLIILNIKNLSSGIYFISVQDEKSTWTAKFVKE